jgi:glyoxylase I family protein
MTRPAASGEGAPEGTPYDPGGSAPGALRPGSRPLLNGLHHVALIVSDYPRSRAFYTEILGLPVTAETRRAERDSWKLDLALPDGTRLEVFSFPTPPARPTRPEACGLRHLALSVPDISAWITHLRGHGIAVEPLRIDPLTGARFTFFRDPDGLPIELYSSPT